MNNENEFSEIESVEKTVKDCDIVLEKSMPFNDAREDLKRRSDELELKLKEEFSEFIKQLVIVWIAFIIFMIFFTGTGYIRLSDTVLITLITGTSVNIIGLIIIVARHLFPEKSK